MPDPAKQQPSSSLPPEEEERLVTSAVTEKVGVEIDELAALFLLERVKQFGPQKFKELRQAGIPPAAVLDEPRRLPQEGKRADTFRRAIAELGAEDRALARQRAVRQILRSYENQARILTYRSLEYPPNVYESNTPIQVLYVRGSAGVLRERKAIACVGSRKIRPPYAFRHEAFSRLAVSEGWTISSGFALGADTIGHEIAYEQQGRTVLVMPCGLDRPFPPENRSFWQRLVEYPHAAIVSEFPFGTPTSALTLRKRNKLIVAFALAVLMSQSAEKGGAMNAYRFAIEQHKSVATFEPDGLPDSSGNQAIAEGRSLDKRRPVGKPLFGPDGARPRVFPAQHDDPAGWSQWLQTLSFSI